MYEILNVQQIIYTWKHLIYNVLKNLYYHGFPALKSNLLHPLFHAWITLSITEPGNI